MADERVAYPDSSRRFEQLSCIKYFHPNYGLFYMIIRSLKDFLKFQDFYFNSKLKQQNTFVTWCYSSLSVLQWGHGVGLTQSKVE